MKMKKWGMNKMNRYTIIFRTHQPKMHCLYTLEDIYNICAHRWDPYYADSMSMSLVLIDTSHEQEDDFTILKDFIDEGYAVITSLKKAKSAINGKAGTVISKY